MALDVSHVTNLRPKTRRLQPLLRLPRRRPGPPHLPCSLEVDVAEGWGLPVLFGSFLVISKACVGASPDACTRTYARGGVCELTSGPGSLN